MPKKNSEVVSEGEDIFLCVSLTRLGHIQFFLKEGLHCAFLSCMHDFNKAAKCKKQPGFLVASHIVWSMLSPKGEKLVFLGPTLH